MGKRSALATLDVCARCEVGSAHAAGEARDTWPDGAPVELAGAIVFPEDKKMQPGSQNLTGAAETPPADPPLEGSGKHGDAGEVLEGPPARLSWGGRVLTYQAWAAEAECSISPHALRKRIAGGWSVRDAITRPALPKRGPRGPQKRPRKRAYAPPAVTSSTTVEAAASTAELAEAYATIERLRLEVDRLGSKVAALQTRPPTRVERPPAAERVTRQNDAVLLLAWISGRNGPEAEAEARSFCDRLRTAAGQ